MRLRDLSFLESNLIAHRGFFDNANGIPENSMIAFERAIENSYIIELDVHLLKDGKIVVFHDDNLGRMTGVDKKIKDCTYEDIKNLRLLKTNEKIPLFEDVLRLVDGRVAILIELKYDVKVGLLEQKILPMLHKYTGKYAVQSFNPMTIMWFRKNAPQIIRGQLAIVFLKSKMYYIKRYII